MAAADRGNTIKNNSYLYGEYDNQYNNYKPGNPLPQKIHGLYMRYNGLMRFRPTQRLLSEIPYTPGQVANGYFYSQHFNWILVVVTVGSDQIIYIFDSAIDYNSAPLATFTLTTNSDVIKTNFLELELKYNSLNAVGNTDKYAILISGLNLNLKYIAKDNSGVIYIADYKINMVTNNINTPIVKKAELFENRLTLLTVTNALLHSSDAVAVAGNAYEDFNLTLPSGDAVETRNINAGKAFETKLSLLGGEVVFDITNERRQLVLLSNNGLSIVKTIDTAESFSVDNVSFYRIENFNTFPGKTEIFANYAVYASIMGLRVRAYSQIGTLYSPSIEPGCIPLPTICPEMRKITSIKNIDEDQSMAIVDDGVCYFISYPRQIKEDPYLSPAGSIYPRTTYFESDDFEVLDIANNVESLLLKRNSDGVLLLTFPDLEKGFLSMFANSYVPQIKVLTTTDMAPGIKITVENALVDLIKFYMMIDDKWYLFTKLSTDTFATNFDTPAVTPGTTYDIFPAVSYDIGALFPKLYEFGEYSWSYSCLFNGDPLHIDGKGSNKVSFSIPNPLNIVDSINKCVIHRAIMPGELTFESDTPPSQPSATSQILLVFKEKTKDFLSFCPVPQQDQNASSMHTERVMSLLKFPVTFTTMTNATSIEIRPVLNNQDTKNLTLVRFLFI